MSPQLQLLASTIFDLAVGLFVAMIVLRPKDTDDDLRAALPPPTDPRIVFSVLTFCILLPWLALTLVLAAYLAKAAHRR